MSSSPEPAFDEVVTRVVDILDRREEIPALEALVSAVRGRESPARLTTSAIVLDANVFLRIPSHRKSSDIMDYLTGLHDRPVVVPGQVIQEFWNNHLSAVDTVYKTFSKKYADMNREIAKSRLSGVLGVESIGEAVEAFRIDNEHVFEPELMSKTVSFLERLISKALVPFAPRGPFVRLAGDRKRAKTPPGFKDDGDGDFLVWVDLLWGLLKAQRAGAEFENVIMLSHDTKVDWSRGRVAHPVLIAELKAVLGAQFEIWTLDQFAEAIVEN